MGVMKHLGSVWKQPKQNILQQPAVMNGRLEARTVFQRIERPTRLDAARRVGYRAKQGITVDTRVRRGGLRKGKIHVEKAIKGWYQENHHG